MKFKLDTGILINSSIGMLNKQQKNKNIEHLLLKIR